MNPSVVVGGRRVLLNMSRKTTKTGRDGAASTLGSSRSRMANSKAGSMGGVRPFGSASDVSIRFPRWPEPEIESDGDYRKHTYLEKVIGGPLYEHQSSLERLPVPESLEDTLQRMIPTATPLVETAKEGEDFHTACRSLVAQASTLQRRLRQRAETEWSDSSWLQYWWNSEGYLKVRDTTVVYVSYFFHFSDDSTIAPSPNMMVQRAAAIVVALAEYRQRVCSGQLPVETLGKKKIPLCSVAFKYLFNASRIPRTQHDSYKVYDPSLHRHCIVSCRGQFFSLDFVQDAETGQPVTLDQLEQALQAIVDVAQQKSQNGDAIRHRLAILTSSNRTRWANARSELLRVGGLPMQTALEKLQSGAMLLCLDDEEEPVSRDQCATLFLHGVSHERAARNRWFDKSIQVMVTRNGKAGYLGEHSMVDGMPVVGLADYLTKRTYRDIRATTPASSVAQPPAAPYSLFEDLENDLLQDGSRVTQFVQEAEVEYAKLVDDHELNVQSFQGYGSSYIKQSGFSPDAFVQMAIQLATYRLFGTQCATYEATQMRRYLHGRTETTRAVSPASSAFVQRMGLRPMTEEDSSLAASEKLQLLREAVQTHVDYISNASVGRGVDRHLFGLAMSVGEDESAPDLFQEPVYNRAKRWRVSTSNLSHPRFDTWGFGEVVPDGVGVAYSVHADSCVFSLAARKEHSWTERLSHHLEEALVEMRQIVEMGKAANPSSKL